MPHLKSGPSLAGRRIGLLGGSFNPAHDGHRAISLYALKRLGLHQIWWLVSPQNPLKSKQGMAFLSERVLAAKRVARDARIIVMDLENEAGTRYTIDTLHTLKRRFPRTRFVWLMGADNLRQLPRWRKWADIFNCVPVAVFRRPAYAAGRRNGKAATRFDRAWMPAASAKTLVLAKSPAWLLLNNRLDPTSSTEIRGKRGED
jgi:nicotinate-nucleotide adenylyltransferase